MALAGFLGSVMPPCRRYHGVSTQVQAAELLRSEAVKGGLVGSANSRQIVALTTQVLHCVPDVCKLNLKPLLPQPS